MDAELFDVASPALPPLAGKFLVGTSGYMFPDWRGTVYPAHLGDRELLPYYLNEFKFNALELNVTFYQMPSARSLESFAARTPPGYHLAVKAHRDITHGTSRDVPTAALQSFSAALAPLRECGKLAAVVLQFPFAFRNTDANREFITACREQLPNDPLVVEFRHESWMAPETDRLLAGLGCTHCCVDEPALKGLMPLHVAATAPLFYARFHGRNPAWFTAGEKERYDYDYADRELQELLQRVRSVAEKSTKLLVFFNNCHMGKAVKNAMRFREMIEEE